MEPEDTAQFDQQKASATERLAKAKSFIVITTPDYGPGQANDEELPDDFELDIEVALGCDDLFLRHTLDLLMRNTMARMIFPEMFDEWGRPRGQA